MSFVNYDTNTLNNVIIDFCERNGISKSDLDKIYESDMIKNNKLTRINPIVHTYGIRDISGPEEKDVLVSDIIGFEPYNDKSNLFEILNTCYSDNNNSYGIRANDKLRLSKEEMLKEMESTLSYEPITLDEIEGKLLVSHNGCHRASILKLLYIDEALKGINEQDLNEKYKFKGKVSKYDMTMTYMNYMLQMMGAVDYIKIEYNEMGKPTGNYEIVTDTKTSATRDDVINLFNEALRKNPDKVDLSSINMYASIPSFKDFLKEYVLKENEYGNSRNNL